MSEDQAEPTGGGASRSEPAGGLDPGQSSEHGFGRLLVERSGGIGGMLLVWEVDIDASSRRDELGARVAELPWSAGAGRDAAASAPSGADRFAYLIESRFGRVRFGEGQMPQEWKRLVDEVREVAEPHRRPPG